MKKGSGSFGDVWKAVDGATQETVAIKVLKRMPKVLVFPNPPTEGAKCCAAAPGAANVAIIKRGMCNCSFTVIGNDLHDVAPEWHHSRNTQQIARMRLDVPTAELELFASGLAHNDIKPENVLVNRFSGDAQLVDFGFVSRASSAKRKGKGTDGFNPPETFNETGTFRGFESDLWAIGKVLRQVSVGRKRLGCKKEPSLFLSGVDTTSFIVWESNSDERIIGGHNRIYALWLFVNNKLYPPLAEMHYDRLSSFTDAHDCSCLTPQEETFFLRSSKCLVN